MSTLTGRKWSAVINGRKAINGALYSVTMSGAIEEDGQGSSIYDVMMELAEHLQAENREMELPDSFRITLYPPQQ